MNLYPNGSYQFLEYDTSFTYAEWAINFINYTYMGICSTSFDN